MEYIIRATIEFEAEIRVVADSQEAAISASNAMTLSEWCKANALDYQVDIGEIETQGEVK